MKINIYPKYYIEDDTKDVSSKYLISIVGSVEYELPYKIQNRYKKCWTATFEDVRFDPNVVDESDLNGVQPFESCHVELICNIIDEIKSENKFTNNIEIDIHCSAGVSRSPAVAIGIALYLDDKDLLHQILKDHKHIIPNPRILSYFYVECNPISCDDVFEMINWYRYAYHNYTISMNPPDYIVNEISLKDT